MIGDFLNRLLSAAPEPLSDTDARLAIAALLVRVARSDGDYASVEIANIDRVLATRYALTESDADALRREGEALEAEAPDTVRFTRAIKECVAYEERLAVIEALWKIVCVIRKYINKRLILANVIWVFFFLLFLQ